ncbi:hypothetical protein SAY87_021123 [Trapa incisa]|uniref:Fungal lipase-type domain-containing protein n=1 Tax=Trapa incisa TaxID=236973 RepID=A0AAN7JQR0_9MYRT|nr:hypothetical protein SAY87_021123 [Trapa incisa]
MRPSLPSSNNRRTVIQSYSSIVQSSSSRSKKNSSLQLHPQKNLEHLPHPLGHQQPSRQYATATRLPPLAKLGRRWMEYQGINYWDGLLDPLDDNLRREILRYGNFVEAAYKACDFHPSSPTYARRRFSKTSMFERCGLRDSGYRITKNLWATSGIELPRWAGRKVPRWASTCSSWIGFVAVCQDKEEIARLGRRDIVVALRGTVICLEWLENLRAALTHLPDSCGGGGKGSGHGPMVQSGFLSLYTSRSPSLPSLQEMVRGEIARLVWSYGDERLSLTVTGHSLGAALATLAANDVKMSLGEEAALFVTAISFGGPRVGDEAFRNQLELRGTRILRIVNSDDVITKVPGFTIGDDGKEDGACDVDAQGCRKYVVGIPLAAAVPRWTRRCMAGTRWVYAEVGEELRLCSKDSPYLRGIDVAACHDLKTYLHLVSRFVSSKCPFSATPNMLPD